MTQKIPASVVTKILNTFQLDPLADNEWVQLTNKGACLFWVSEDAEEHSYQLCEFEQARENGYYVVRVGDSNEVLTVVWYNGSWYTGGGHTLGNPGYSVISKLTTTIPDVVFTKIESEKR